MSKVFRSVQKGTTKKENKLWEKRQAPLARLREFQLFEEGKLIAHPKSLADAKKTIRGLDLARSTVDADPQEYELKDARGKIVYFRKRIRTP